MRCYHTTTVPNARSIFKTGWTDVHQEFGRWGVYLSTVPLDVNDGFAGELILCLEVPDDLFARFDVTDDLQRTAGYGLALIPAGELNSLGKPLVYNHDYAGLSRRELVKSIERWESAADVSAHGHANEMKEAIAFFDEIGWLTPLKLKEAR